MKYIYTYKAAVWVDDEDYDLNKYNWCIRGGYCSRMVPGTKEIQYLHLIIAQRMGLVITEQIDHIDRNKVNCQRNNLRIATHTQNMMNIGITSKNKSGYKGVFWLKTRNKWTARIKVGNERLHLGMFHTAEEAARSYDISAKRVYGEYAWLNFPDKET